MLWVSFLLLAAVVTEVTGTLLLPRADGFSNPGWTAVVLAAYAVSIWLMALVVRHLDVGVAYAIWIGGGTAGIVLVGALVLNQRPDAIQLLALGLIVVGAVVLNLRGAH